MNKPVSIGKIKATVKGFVHAVNTPSDKAIAEAHITIDQLRKKGAVK